MVIDAVALGTCAGLFWALILTTPALAAVTPVGGKQMPNVVILLADDLGYGDVQSYNPERGRIPTPHIDRLATEGMRFTDAHSSSGVCSPSRYTLLTGRYHWRSRLQSGIVNPWERPLIAPDRMTLGTLARQHGYRTVCIGKWHLGWQWPIPPEHAARFRERPNPDSTVTEAHRTAWREVFSQPIGGGPTSSGFDAYFGTDVPNWPPFCFIQNDRTLGIPDEFLPERLLRNNQASIQGPALKDWALEAVLPALGDQACAEISRAVREMQPFLLYLPMTSPHTPLAVNAAWKNRSGLNAYADFVMETDAFVGRILAALEASGADRNTLVVFTSDNGCAPYVGKSDLERMGHFPSGPLRGAKADAWEGGHRVPFLVRWPAVVKPGAVCGQLVHHADLMATLADIFGSKLPEKAGEDSFSLLPLLQGNDKPIREHAVSASIQGVPALREGSMKFIPAAGSGGWGQGGEQTQTVQLYDLAVDPGESDNLASAQPERVRAMEALLERLITAGRSTPGTPQQNDIEVIRHPRKVPPPEGASRASAARGKPALP